MILNKEKLEKRVKKCGEEILGIALKSNDLTGAQLEAAKLLMVKFMAEKNTLLAIINALEEDKENDYRRQRLKEDENPEDKRENTEE